MSINAHYRKAPHHDQHIKKYIAEALGVFILTLAVIVAVSSRFAIITPAVAAFTVAVLVYAIGHISGTHINPAITVALYSLKKISGKNAIGYIIAQFIGALVARWLADYLVGYVPGFTVLSNFKVGLGEATGALILAFGVALVVFDKVSEATSGIVIGVFLFLGILVASVVSNGILNPAVALGVGSFSLAYVAGPVIGAVIGMWLYHKLRVKGQG